MLKRVRPHLRLRPEEEGLLIERLPAILMTMPEEDLAATRDQEGLLVAARWRRGRRPNRPWADLAGE